MGRACRKFGEEERSIPGFGGETSGNNDLKDLGTDGRIILKGIFKKWDVGAWTGLIWPRIGIGCGFL